MAEELAEGDELVVDRSGGGADGRQPVPLHRLLTRHERRLAEARDREASGHEVCLGGGGRSEGSGEWQQEVGAAGAEEVETHHLLGAEPHDERRRGHLRKRVPGEPCPFRPAAGEE